MQANFNTNNEVKESVYWNRSRSGRQKAFEYRFMFNKDIKGHIWQVPIANWCSGTLCKFLNSTFSPSQGTKVWLLGRAGRISGSLDTFHLGNNDLCIRRAWVLLMEPFSGVHAIFWGKRSKFSFAGSNRASNHTEIRVMRHVHSAFLFNLIFYTSVHFSQDEFRWKSLVSWWTAMQVCVYIVVQTGNW